VLGDICGTETRAEFWTTFSNVMIAIVPSIFALHISPSLGTPESWAVSLSHQIKWGLIGLAVTVLTMGVVVSLFIPAANRLRTVKEATPGGAA